MPEIPPDGEKLAWDEEMVFAAVGRMLSHKFSDRDILRTALTHSSAADNRLQSNERMEFLGDAVLGQVVCEHLYQAHPELEEGRLTEIKSNVVSRSTLARVGRELKLQHYLLLGKGIALQKRLPGSVLANAFEALVAALYLDGGYNCARAFILSALGEMLEEGAERGGEGNYKSLLQEREQALGRPAPTYVVDNAEGPDHSKTYYITVWVADSPQGRGSGKSKKLAEQAAARAALHNLDKAQDESTDDSP